MVMFPFESVSSSRHPPDPVVPCSAFSLLCAIVIGTSVEIEPKLVRAIAAAGADGLLIEVHHDPGGEEVVTLRPTAIYALAAVTLPNFRVIGAAKGGATRPSRL